MESDRTVTLIEFLICAIPILLVFAILAAAAEWTERGKAYYRREREKGNEHR